MQGLPSRRCRRTPGGSWWPDPGWLIQDQFTGSGQMSVGEMSFQMGKLVERPSTSHPMTTRADRPIHRPPSVRSEAGRKFDIDSADTLCATTLTQCVSPAMVRKQGDGCS
jgi:hypothetical protein